MKCYGKLDFNVHGWFEKDRPSVKSETAIIRPLILGVCTSDVHQIQMEMSTNFTVLGHEGIGEIVEIGDHVTDFKPGDRVVIPATTPIWKTEEARSGVSMHSGGFCGGCTMGSVKDGLMAEFALINDPDMNLALLPDNVNPLAASMAGDMMSAGLSGAELAEVSFGDTVVVIGAGPLGCMAIAGAAMRGAGRIIAVDTRKKSVEVAKHYGATDIVNHKDGSTNMVNQILFLTGGRGADCCIIAGGGEDILDQAMRITCLGGRIANLNTFAYGESLHFSLEGWGLGLANKTIRGGLCPGGRYRIEKMLELLKYDRLDPTKIITHVFKGFQYIEEAFDLMIRKEQDVLKPVVVCDEEFYDDLISQNYL